MRLRRLDSEIRNTGYEMTEQSDKPATTIHFKHGFNIKDVSEMHGQLLPTIEEGAVVDLDFSELGSIDTATMQMLLSYSDEAGKNGVSINWLNCPQVMHNAAELLGIGTELGLVGEAEK